MILRLGLATRQFELCRIIIMKARYEPRIDLANRTKLEEVIPLSTPFIVFADPSESVAAIKSGLGKRPL